MKNKENKGEKITGKNLETFCRDEEYQSVWQAHQAQSTLKWMKPNPREAEHTFGTAGTQGKEVSSVRARIRMPSDSQECTVSQKKTRECRARCQPSTQQRAGPPIQYKGNTDGSGTWESDQLAPVCPGLSWLQHWVSHSGNPLSHGQSSAHKTKSPYSKNPLIPGKLGSLVTSQKHSLMDTFSGSY